MVRWWAVALRDGMECNIRQLPLLQNLGAGAGLLPEIALEPSQIPGARFQVPGRSTGFSLASREVGSWRRSERALTLRFGSYPRIRRPLPV